MYMFSFWLGRHLPDKAIDLMDEACAKVRVQLGSQPEEIDNLERKRILLEVDLHALEQEKDKGSKARVVEVSVCFQRVVGKYLWLLLKVFCIICILNMLSSL